jgi:hypothetical protein
MVPAYLCINKMKTMGLVQHEALKLSQSLIHAGCDQQKTITTSEETHILSYSSIYQEQLVVDLIKC